jgi:hypothetical protein
MRPTEEARPGVIEGLLDVLIARHSVLPLELHHLCKITGSYGLISHSQDTVLEIEGHLPPEEEARSS